MASKGKEVSTVGEPLLDENPDRFCMFPIKYPVSMACMIHSKTSLPYYLLSMQETLHDLSSYCRVLLHCSRCLMGA